MEHEEAQQLMATERYLLGELTPEMRESFEEHVFGCSECALDLSAASAFVDQAKEELSRKPVPANQLQPVRATPSWWSAWLRPAIVIPALAILLAFLAYQDFVVLPGLHRQVAWAQAPRVLASVSLMGGTRGGTTPTLTVSQGRPFLLFLDIPPDPQSSSFVAELYNASGNVEWSVPISASAARDTVSVRAPGVNNAGSYTLVVSGVSANGSKTTAVARYPFELNIQSR